MLGAIPQGLTMNLKERVTQVPQVLVGLVSLSLALVISSAIAADAVRGLQRGNQVIRVTGSARRAITSDYIIWSFRVESQDASLQRAYRQVTGYTERIRRFLQQQAVPANEIVFAALENIPLQENINGRETGRILAYRLVQRVKVSSAEVDKIAALVNQANNLINEGVPLISDPPQYIYRDLAKLRVEMVAEAVRDAQARAQSIAQATGSRVGRVRNVDTGVFQITSRYSTDVSDYGIYDTSSKEKDITAVVSVSFSLD
ncbi:MAG: SIMPL domain-containing protein [Gloeomargarita sp. SKYBB_i_bin120]|nr:SIMPL domain-containing protein [Gloeomargarita sp. SKYG98]MCS7293163.1 SIMPL domain-containing protein [Gloeomargarita sp. SKYB120]MDW8178728.1 SIMPL domain-containing protein [Gloeomargarita sp. SKYBB_i_bin120]